MTRYVIDAPVAIRLARERVTMGAEHQPVASSSLRSQVLSLLYRGVRRAERTAAAHQLCPVEIHASSLLRLPLWISPERAGPNVGTPIVPSGDLLIARSGAVATGPRSASARPTGFVM